MKKLIELTPNAIANLNALPEHMRGIVQDYFEYGRPPGSFLRAVLENKLMEAAMHADDHNKYALADYAFWLYNFAPGRPMAWGSEKSVDDWIQAGADLRSAA